MDISSVEDLRGLTLKAVDVSNTEVVFTLENGDKYKLYHEQNCCEGVSLEDVCGNVNDLVGSPLLMSVESINPDGMPKVDENYCFGTYTWTFYQFATVKGYVTMRWYGESNGYYSESVNFCKC